MRCPLCGTDNSSGFDVVTQEAGASRHSRVLSCACGLQYLEDYAEDRSSVYGDEYAMWARSAEADERVIGAAKREAFRQQLAELERVVDAKGMSFLDVGTGKGYLLDVASEIGFDCHAVEISRYAAEAAEKKFPSKVFTGTLEQARHPDASFDIVSVTDVIEHVADPHGLVAEIGRVVKPGGHLFAITPDVSSWSRRLLGGRWFQYKYEHVTYWDARSLTALLDRHGFTVKVMKPNVKRYTMAYYERYFAKYAFLGPIGGWIAAVIRMLPRRLRDIAFSNPVSGEMLVIAERRR
jgi:2-polyprenyl-3-methyl-5-hydroxy-6-metoxy-1,4-benzoquinol methylase